MGVVLLILAILFFVSIFLIFRLFEKWKINNSQAIVSNYLTASLFSFALYQGELPITAIPQQSWFIPAVILGILFMLSFLLFAISTQKAGMAITAVASKMSVLIPVFVGAYLYEYESLSVIKIIGLSFALLSFYLIFKKENTEKIPWQAIMLPLLIFFFSGANDSLLKYIREAYFKTIEMDIHSEILFMGSLFSTSFVSGLIVFGVFIFIKKETISIKSLIAGIGLGIVNFLSAFSMFKAMGYFESAVFFPIFNVGIVSLSALIGILFFKEKMSKLNLGGVALAIVTILLLTIS